MTRPKPPGIVISGDPETDAIITVANLCDDEVELLVYELPRYEDEWVWARDMSPQVTFEAFDKLVAAVNARREYGPAAPMPAEGTIESALRGVIQHLQMSTDKSTAGWRHSGHWHAAEQLERALAQVAELREQLRIAEAVRDDARAASARDLEARRAAVRVRALEQAVNAYIDAQADHVARERAYGELFKLMRDT